MVVGVSWLEAALDLLEGTTISTLYQAVLEEDVRGVLSHLKLNQMMEQDNDAKHKSTLTREWF